MTTFEQFAHGIHVARSRLAVGWAETQIKGYYGVRSVDDASRAGKHKAAALLILCETRLEQMGESHVEPLHA